MKIYYIWVFFCFLISISIFYLINANLNQYDESKTVFKNNLQVLLELEGKQKIDKFTQLDLKLAKNEWNSLYQTAKSHTNFWKTFLDEKNNISKTHSIKSSSSINTDLTRLLSQLLRECEKLNIKFNNPSDTPSPFMDNDVNTYKFGFGFSGYDGFWPSFEKDEANLIAIQSKMIKQIVSYFINSFEETDKPTLYSLKREPVGPTDLQFIKDDKIESNFGIKNLRDTGFVSSYIFQITFNGKTENLRTFVNQLRPPFSLRSISVKRFGASGGSFGEGFFSNNSNQGTLDILPIIREINSIFTIQLEYVIATNTDLISELNAEFEINLEPFISEEYLSEI